jgi:hypothetical protein
MKQFLFSCCLAALTVSAHAQATKSAPLKQKTAFQTSSPWMPEIDVRSDIAIVYGVNDRKGMTFEQRVQSWRDHGYQTQFMTGIAWGELRRLFFRQVGWYQPSGRWPGYAKRRYHFPW